MNFLKDKFNLVLLFVILFLIINSFFILRKIPLGNLINNTVYRPDTGRSPYKQYIHDEAKTRAESYIIQSNNATVPVEDVENIWNIIEEGVKEKYVVIEYSGAKMNSNNIYWNRGESLLIPVSGIEDIELSRMKYDFYTDDKEEKWYLVFDDGEGGSGKSYYLENSVAYRLDELDGKYPQFYTDHLGTWYVLAENLFKISDTDLDVIASEYKIDNLFSNHKGEWIALSKNINDQEGFIVYSLIDKDLIFKIQKDKGGSASFNYNDEGDWYFDYGLEFMNIYYFIDEKNKRIWPTINTNEIVDCDPMHGCYYF